MGGSTGYLPYLDLSKRLGQAEVQPRETVLGHLGFRPLWQPGSYRGHRVIVIGLGLAGCTAALELAALGFNVIALEAGPQAGGRTRSKTAGTAQNWYDDGGELIGSNHALWEFHRRARGLNFIEIAEYQGPVSPIVPDAAKRLFTAAQAESIFEEWKQLAEPLAAAARGGNLAEPWSTPGAAALDRTSVAEWLAGQPLSDAARQLLELQFVANQGVSSSADISMLGMLVLIAAHTDADRGLNFFDHTETHRLVGGSQQLARMLVEEMQTGSFNCRIEFNKRVDRIETGTDCTRVYCGKQGYSADFVVLATPVSLWSAIEFSPPLDRRLRVHTGNNVKVFLLRPPGYRGFKPGLSALAAFGRPDRGLCQVFWRATEGQPLDGCEVFAAFSGGPAAYELSQMSPAERRKRCAAEFEALYPGITSGDTRFEFACWPIEPLFLGGYSCPAPGDVTGLWPLLRSGHGKIHLAGEACSNGWSFMNGAMDSGVQTAARIYWLCGGNCR